MAPSTPARSPTAMRLAGISLLAAGVAVALYVAGRVYQVNPASSLFGQQYGAAVAPKTPSGLRLDPDRAQGSSWRGYAVGPHAVF